MNKESIIYLYIIKEIEVDSVLTFPSDHDTVSFSIYKDIATAVTTTSTDAFIDIRRDRSFVEARYGVEYE